jgi:CheY-like chemotaxis protein
MNRTIIAVVDDMFFAAKIRAAAEALGVTLRTVRTLELVLSIAREGAELIIVDLHATKIDPQAVARALKRDQALASIPLLGFFSHVAVDLQRAALAAGYDKVIPRSVFARDLAQILEGKTGEAA